MNDPYETLGVDQSASAEEINRAYRKLAGQHHPDANESGDATQFKLIVAAYEILGDEKRRKMYDECGTTEPQRNVAASILVSLLNDAMLNAVNSGVSIKKADLVKLVSNKIKSQKKSLEKKISDSKKRIGDLKEAASLMHVDSGENLLRAAMLEPVKILNGELENARLQIEQLGECEEMLSHYRYDCEKQDGFSSTWPPKFTSGNWQAYTFNTGQ